ncbi:MAG: hypothetical protein WC571_02340 [Candidatus Omnitrophota bacterium]
MVEKAGVEKIVVFAYVILPLVSLLVNVVTQILSFRMAPKIGLLKSIFLGFFAGFCSLFIFEILYSGLPGRLFRHGISSGITNMVIYVLLGYCYFHFVGLGETARRIRMLIEIFRSKDGLSLDEILSKYNAREILDKRMGRLISNGQLICREGRYFIGKPAVLFIAGAATFLKLLLLGRKSETARGLG